MSFLSLMARRGLFLAAFVLPAPAWGQITQLPQVTEPVSLSSPDRDSLEPVFRRIRGITAAALPLSAMRLLIDRMPPRLRDACPAMLQLWGEEPNRNGGWSVLVEYVYHTAERSTAYLVYRCNAPGAGYDQYADERLLALIFEPGQTTLRQIPFTDDCSHCSDLYRVHVLGLPEEVEGGRLLEFRTIASSDNPCCDGPSQWRREQLHWILMPGTAVLITLDLVVERYEHDDEVGDTERKCRAELARVRDSQGRLVELAPDRQCAPDGSSADKAGRYRWNPERRAFDGIPFLEAPR